MPTNLTVSALGGEGDIPVFRARPDGMPRAAVIVIPEIFGVNSGIVSKCEDWASQGYLALAPDLFWRFAPGSELDPDVEAEFKQAIGNMMQYSVDDGVKDIEACIKHIRAQEGVTMVGAVGFCLGGRLAYMTATRTDIDASVGYYGVMIDQLLGESHGISRPLMLHIAGADHFVLPEAQAAIHAALDSHPRVTLHDYPGLDHGFAASEGSRRDEAGARLADERTRNFFNLNLT